jgi:branched-chain amino acid transport system substrate-binding protein
MSKARKIFSAVLLLSLVLGAFGVSAQGAVPEGPVKIAALGPFTGPAASIGQEQLNWAKQAVADFNEATGWSVELVEGDTQLDPAIAVTVAESVIADEAVLGVVGPAGSQEVEATAQMFTDARLTFISGSATRPSLTTSGFDTFFRTVPTDAVQGPTDGNFLFNELGATNLFVIDDQTSYSVGLADEASAAFEAAGGTIAGRESVTQDDVDFSSLVTLIDSTGADAVFFPGQIASQGAQLARQLQEQGVEVILMGADGFDSSDFIAVEDGVTEGAYYSSFAPDIHGSEGASETIERYEAEFGEFTTTFGPPTYVATLTVLEAMQRAFEAGDLSREAVRNEVANTNMETSILGMPIVFDENGDIQGASFYIFQIEDGAGVFIPGEAASPEATPEATPAM